MKYPLNPIKSPLTIVQSCSIPPFVATYLLGMWPHIFGSQKGFVAMLEEQQLEANP
jgi:hypothetical protein